MRRPAADRRKSPSRISRASPEPVSLRPLRPVKSWRGVPWACLLLLTLLVPLEARAEGVAARTLRVVGPEGEPVAGAAVEVRARPPSESLFSYLLGPLVVGETDEGGFLPDPLPALREILILVDHRDFLPAVVTGEELAAAQGRLVLQAGRTWKGRAEIGVLPGGMIEEGYLCASWEEEGDLWGPKGPWRRCRRMTSEGRFELPGLPDRPVTFTVRGEGVLPLEVTARPGQAVLRLHPGIRLSGRVLDAAEEPVAGATVRPAASSSQPAGQATTAEDGAFQVAVARLPTTLTVQGEGFLEAKVRVRQPSIPVEVRLLPGAEVTGTLVGHEGLPPEEARLVIERWTETGLAAEPVAASFNGGAFRFTLAQEGAFDLRIVAQGHEPILVEALEPAVGRRLDLGTLVLKRGGAILGQAVDALTGVPLPGTVVRTVPMGTQGLLRIRDFEVPSTVAAADGRFLLSGLPAGGYELRLEHEGRALTTRRLLLATHETADLGSVPMGPGRIVLGTITDRHRPGAADGASPEAGATGAAEPEAESYVVRVYDPAHQVLLPLLELQAPGGMFEGPALAPGRYRLTVDGGRRLLTQEVEVPPAPGPAEIPLELASVRLEGRILRNGAPVAGGSLYLEPALDPARFRGKLTLRHSQLQDREGTYGVPEGRLAATLGEDGRFALAGVPAGLFQGTVVEDPSGAIVRRWITVPEERRASVSLELSGATLRGRAVDAATGLGLAADVRILGEGGLPVTRVQAREDGSFEVPDLSPGPYTLEARHEGYGAVEAAAEARLEDDGGNGGPPLVLALAPGSGGRLEVELLREDGSALASSMTTLLTASGHMAAAGFTDRRGRKAFTNLAPGAYAVVWQDAVAGTGVSPLQRVEGGTTETLVLTLPRGGPLEAACPLEACAGAAVDVLRLVDAQGLDLTPYLSGAAPRLRFAADGRLSLGPVAPGTYRLQIEAGGGEHSFSRRVEISGE